MLVAGPNFASERICLTERQCSLVEREGVLGFNLYTR